MKNLRPSFCTINGVHLGVFPDRELINGALGVTNPADVAWLMNKLTPHAEETIEQPLVLHSEAALRHVPTTDIWRTMILKQWIQTAPKRAGMADRAW